MKISLLKYFFPVFSCVLALFCCAARTEGNTLSALGFYGTPDEIILKLDNDSSGYREHFLLGLAFKSKNKPKDAIFHFANSCFNYTENSDLKLYPYPVYEFLDELHIKSEYFNDAVYEIALLFSDYQEYEYVIKFIDLMSDSDRALYRDGVILKSKALLQLNKFGESLSVLRDLYSRYNDAGSKSDIIMRAASVYEKQNDYGRAVNEYFKIIGIDCKSWQSAAASERISQLIGTYEYKFKEPEIIMLIAAFYNASKYGDAIDLIIPLLKKNPSRQTMDSAYESLVRSYVKINKDTEAEKIAFSFKLAEDKIKYQMIMADELWSSNRKAKSEKTYRGLVDKIKEPSLKLALKRITLYAQRERTAGFEKEAEEFVNKYPDDPAAEYLLWILAREMLGKNDNKGALACLEKALSIFPNGIYSAQIRFWTHKILPRVNRPDEAEQILTDLVIKNPDSYYMWNAVLNYKDKYKPEDLNVLFEKAVNAADARKALFYNAILFFHDGDFDSRDARIGNMRKFGVYEKYTELESVIRGLKVDSQHEDTLRGIEKYFAIGYAGGINRETALIPDNADSQRSKYIAFSHYGARYGSSFHALTGTLKLVNRRPLAENLALLPRGIIKNLYPDAFGDEVGRRSSEMDIDKKFVLSVMKAESSFNNRAVSPAGAVGLMQIMPSTGKGIARELNIADFDLTIPQTSIYFGVKYIAWLKKIFNNDFDDIVAGYNAGAGNVKKWKKSINTDDRDYYIENIPFDETRHYILRTRKNYYIYNFLQSGKGF